MRKNNGGYALPFALIVIVILGLAASAILSYSLNNYVNQKTTTQRMIDKYAAQGEIEKIEVILKSKIEHDGFGNNYLKSVLPQEGITWELQEPDLTGKHFGSSVDCLYLLVTSTYETAQISCRFKLAGDFQYSGLDDHGKGLYNYSDLSITYEEYQISAADTSAESPEGGGSDG